MYDENPFLYEQPESISAIIWRKNTEWIMGKKQKKLYLISPYLSKLDIFIFLVD